MMINFDAFLKTLPIMLYGMLGIFTVIIVIYISILIMNYVSDKRK